MTKLTVTPIDLDEPGSHDERLRMMEMYADYEEAREKGDLRASLRFYRRLETMLIYHLETDDGAEPAEALKDVSANQFDALVAALLRADAVPPGSGTS